VANGDEEIVHVATLETRTRGIIKKREFEILNVTSQGVKLRCKARIKTFYRWEYCVEPTDNTGNWIVANATDKCFTYINSLQADMLYWFRVVLVSSTGETYLGPIPAVIH
jgi:hypothetical protein